MALATTSLEITARFAHFCPVDALAAYPLYRATPRAGQHDYPHWFPKPIWALLPRWQWQERRPYGINRCDSWDQTFIPPDTCSPITCFPFPSG